MAGGRRRRPRPDGPIKLIPWNVNGLRSVLGKGFPDFVNAGQPDFLLLQETKIDPARMASLQTVRDFDTGRGFGP